MPHQNTRRALLRGAGSGLGAMAIAALLADDANAATTHDPTIPPKPHHAPKA